MRTTNVESIAGLGADTQKTVLLLPQVSAFSEFGFRKFSADCSEKLTELKERVVADLAKEFSALNARLIGQVVNEADSLAATTPFPALLLPVLAEEKVRTASAWAARQQTIRDQTLALAA